MYDNICKLLAATYPQDLAAWLLGEPLPLMQLQPQELAVEPIRADSLILLQAQHLLLHLEFQTRPEPQIPFRMLDYWTRGQRKFPHHQIKQIVIYLQPTQTSLVYQNYYQAARTRHEFDVLRLWEVEPDVLLRRVGTLPLAVLAGAEAKEQLLQKVAQRIEELDSRRERAEMTAATYVLAGLVLSDNVIKRILRSEMMRESVTFQAILEEGEQKGLQQGEWLGKRQTVLRLLHRKFGSLAPATLAQVERLSASQLEDMAEALLDMQSLADLEQWLAGVIGNPN
ncbi:MAG: Rpn family recombination-promoting nuclease/putative transposase [Gloeomargarita sp. DG_2_bins_126]